MSNQQPSIGRIVHYVSYGTPGGEYESTCRAAIVTEVPGGYENSPFGLVGLCVLNPEGIFLNRNIPYDEPPYRGGTWHWPELVEETS